jgi:hypothetical protein
MDRQAEKRQAILITYPAQYILKLNETLGHWSEISDTPPFFTKVKATAAVGIDAGNPLSPPAIEFKSKVRSVAAVPGRYTVDNR